MVLKGKNEIYMTRQIVDICMINVATNLILGFHRLANSPLEQSEHGDCVHDRQAHKPWVHSWKGEGDRWNSDTSVFRY